MTTHLGISLECHFFSFKKISYLSISYNVFWSYSFSSSSQIHFSFAAHPTLCLFLAYQVQFVLPKSFWCVAFHWSMVDLPGTILLKETDSSSPSFNRSLTGGGTGYLFHAGVGCYFDAWIKWDALLFSLFDLVIINIKLFLSTSSN